MNAILPNPGRRVVCILRYCVLISHFTKEKKNHSVSSNNFVVSYVVKINLVALSMYREKRKMLQKSSFMFQTSVTVFKNVLGHFCNVFNFYTYVFTKGLPQMTVKFAQVWSHGATCQVHVYITSERQLKEVLRLGICGMNKTRQPQI